MEYSHINYDDLLKHYARIFKTKCVNGCIEIPPAYGRGTIRSVQLPNGLQCLICDYTVHQDIIFQRKKNNKHYYVLRFDELGSGPFDTYLLTPKSAVCLMTMTYDWFFYQTKGASIRSLNVLFSEEWMNQFLNMEAVGERISQYLTLRTNKFSYEPMDCEYRNLLAEIIQPSCDQRFRLLHLHNHVMLLLERFFERMGRRSMQVNSQMRISAGDIARIHEVEQYLLKNFALPPGIARLAKMAAMSESKLKSCFKEVYGLSVYQYFQKHRMHKAKAMLVSKKYSLREVSSELGYESPASFSKAFQKVFDQLPSDILQDVVSN